MLIVCPNCATSYDIDAANLPPHGRQVRCVRCRTVWKAEQSQADQLLAAAAAIGPGGEAEGAEAPSVMGTISHSADELASEGAGIDVSAIGETPTAVPSGSDGGDADTNSAGEISDVATEAAGGPAEVEAPSIAPMESEDDGHATRVTEVAPNEEPAADVESIAARKRRRPAKRRVAGWPLTGLQTAMLVLALLDIVLIGWRGDVVRALPQTASFYAMLGLPVNLRGITFDGVATTMEQHEGVPILVVDGNVVNDTRKTAEVPRLKFVVRNAAHEEIYSWTAVPARAALVPGEGFPFRNRLASPPGDARDLVIRFVNRRDMVGGTH